MTMIEAARSTMTAYLERLVDRGAYAELFSPDVSLYLMGTDQEAHGPDAVEGTIRYLHEQAFDAHPELKGLLVDGERAAVEADFVGEHVGEFAGRQPTGKRFRVPYSVLYDLEGDRIKTLRIYMPMDTLLRQLDG
jgi:predicted ester cyclase